MTPPFILYTTGLHHKRRSVLAASDPSTFTGNLSADGWQIAKVPFAIDASANTQGPIPILSPEEFERICFTDNGLKTVEYVSTSVTSEFLYWDDLTTSTMPGGLQNMLVNDNPYRFTFVDSGNQIIGTGINNNSIQAIERRSVNTANDITAVSTVETERINNAQTTFSGTSTPADFFMISSDKCFVLDAGNNNNQGGPRILRYLTTSAWQISGATFDGVIELSGVQGMSRNADMFFTFSKDGKNCFMIHQNVPGIIQFNMGTAWNVSNMSVVATIGDPQESSFAYMGGIGALNNTGAIYGFQLYEPDDGSTDAFFLFSFDTALTPAGGGRARQTVYALTCGGKPIQPSMQDTSAAMPFALSALDDYYTGLDRQPAQGMQWKPDGLRVFFSNDRQIWMMDGTSAYELSTLTTVVSGFVSIGTNNNCDGFCFGNDGNNLYYIERNSGVGDVIRRRLLLSAWDITCADAYDTCVNLASVTELSTITASVKNPVGLCFSNDGNYVYVIDNGDATGIFQLECVNSAWDITTLSMTAFVSLGDTGAPAPQVSTWDTIRQFPQFSNDGKFLYIVGGNVNELNMAYLKTPFMISTMDYVAGTGNTQLGVNVGPTSAVVTALGAAIPISANHYSHGNHTFLFCTDVGTNRTVYKMESKLGAVSVSR
jgi:hypothetical protein